MIESKRKDVVLDTDAYNEIDDQFAIAYLLRQKDILNTKAIYAAPFFNNKSSGPKDGMEKSYDEIIKVVRLCGEEKSGIKILKGSHEYLKDENTPTISDAARDLAQRAMEYTSKTPLYVVAIGAITNIASAILINPDICSRIVVVWLGGHALWHKYTKEFNMYQDIAAARVVMKNAKEFVQLPCDGVVSEFRVSGPELEKWLFNKNELADYLAKNAVHEAESYAAGSAWTRVIWDVTAVAYLTDNGGRFMLSEKRNRVLPEYNYTYEKSPTDKEMTYVYHINRDELMTDLFKKLV